jgi:NarL family two-component system response regulator LiaR
LGRQFDASSISILIADDEPMFRLGLRLMLEREGFRVVADCVDGMEAVNMSEEMREDVAILDRFMPIVNGIDAARAIHRVSPQTRIILLSQYDDPTISVDKLSEWIAGGVHKIHAPEVLVEAIRQVASGALYWPGPHLLAAQRTKAPLSNRERQVLRLLVQGLSMKEIACSLALSVKTIEGHRSGLTTKLEIRDIPGLVRYAMRCGIIPEP